MYKLCSTEKSALQQNLIEVSLLSLMETTPYTDISVTHLCQEAGLSRNVFYRLFDSKDDALCALIDHTLIRWRDFELPCVRHSAEYPIDLLRFLYFWKEQKPLLDALESNGIRFQLLERASLYFYGAGFALPKQLTDHSEENDIEQSVFWITGILSMVLVWHRRGYQKSIDEMARSIIQLCK